MSTVAEAIDVIMVREPQLRLAQSEAAVALKWVINTQAGKARHRLRFGPGPTCEQLARLLDKALVQAEQAGIDPDALVLSRARVKQAEHIIRIRRKAHGLADWISSPTSDVTLTLTPPRTGARYRGRRHRGGPGRARWRAIMDTCSGNGGGNHHPSSAAGRPRSGSRRQYRRHGFRASGKASRRRCGKDHDDTDLSGLPLGQGNDRPDADHTGGTGHGFRGRVGLATQLAARRHHRFRPRATRRHRL
ncbi:uL22 family ribosomal protein [Bordetella holmesii]|nr:50S ribosomal protein L22 [Bordetella holmesii F627]MBO1251514.1 uL22 family ribosomal protein [Bordetella holmesii]MBO1257762.1 uL22 family ribosomal protein [Bordetella holmesii]MBO1260991.1 uL22 family ribosomal protein [Bordetella holmesii]QSY67239.1 uL22 family ribosomal protein [Bordetella holmesii]